MYDMENYTAVMLTPRPFEPPFLMPRILPLNWMNTVFFERRDARMMDFPMIENPWANAAVMLSYLLMVYMGPKIMKWFMPFTLKWPLMIYNFFMVGMSVYILFECLHTAYISKYSMFCQPVDFSDHPLALRMARVVWMYFFTRYIEFTDTLFFILRKKDNQISFLHVYHHVTIAGTWWITANIAPGGMMVHHVALNSFIHVVMYSYYGLSAIGPQMAPYLWWKVHLTKLQLVQFVCMLIIMSTNTTCNDPNFPQILNYVGCVYCITILTLFLNFYIQTYLKNKKKEGGKDASSTKPVEHKSTSKGTPTGNGKVDQNGNTASNGSGKSVSNGSTDGKKHN